MSLLQVVVETHRRWWWSCWFTSRCFLLPSGAVNFNYLFQVAVLWSSGGSLWRWKAETFDESWKRVAVLPHWLAGKWWHTEGVWSVACVRPLEPTSHFIGFNKAERVNSWRQTSPNDWPLLKTEFSLFLDQSEINTILFSVQKALRDEHIVDPAFSTATKYKNCLNNFMYSFIYHESTEMWTQHSPFVSSW